MKYKINDEGLEEGKFPSSTGKQVLIENKASILKTIDDNIIDKDVAMMILVQLEKDAQRHLEADEVTAIPYLGKIKRRAGSKAYAENKETLDAAKEIMTPENFENFRAAMMREAVIRDNKAKVYNYQVARMANKNGKTYWKCVERRGKYYANIRFYCLGCLNYSEPCNEID